MGLRQWYTMRSGGDRWVLDEHNLTVGCMVDMAQFVLELSHER